MFGSVLVATPDSVRSTFLGLQLLVRIRIRVSVRISVRNMRLLHFIADSAGPMTARAREHCIYSPLE